MRLFPHFSDIQINKMTRDPKEWQGAYHKLIQRIKD